MKKLYDLFMDDLIDKASYRNEYEKFQSQIDKLRSCPAAPVRNLDSIKKMLSDDWETVYHTFSDQEKNVFWKSFVQSITVHEDGEMDIEAFADIGEERYASGNIIWWATAKSCDRKGSCNKASYYFSR